MQWTQISRAVVVGLALSASPLWAQSFNNGSLNYQWCTHGAPPGWAIEAGSPDIVDPSCNVGVIGFDFAAPASFSPDGGTWVGLARDGGFLERFGQTVGGFTSGQSYRVSWYASNFGYDMGFGYVNPNQIEVLLGGASIGTGSLLSLGEGWFAQSLVFTATAAWQTLAFQLGSGNRSYMGIDGISVSPATVVPEPATMALLGVGLAAVAAMRRRKRTA